MATLSLNSMAVLIAAFNQSICKISSCIARDVNT